MRRTICKRARGAALLESAFVLGVLLLLLLGIVDRGLATLYFNTVSDAACRLAREAIVHGEMAPPERSDWGPDLYVGTADDESEIAAAVRPLVAPMDPKNVEVRVEWLDGGNRVDQRVQVTITHRHRSSVPFLFGADECVLSAVSTMKIVH
jgi:hypothetical protein